MGRGIHFLTIIWLRTLICYGIWPKKAFTCVLPQEDGHNHIHLLASSCLSTTLAGFLPSISILVAPSLVSDFAHFPEDRDERHELLYTNPMSSMIFPRALLQGPIVAFALLLRLIILLRACTLCAHTSSSCKPSFSFPSFSPLSQPVSSLRGRIIGIQARRWVAKSCWSQ